MNKNLRNLLVAILSFMLAFAIAICTTGCKSKGNKKPASNSKVESTASTQAPVDENITSEPEESLPSDLGDFDDLVSDDQTSSDVFEEFPDDSLIGGPELDQEYDDFFDDDYSDELDDDFFDDFEFDEDIDFDVTQYTNPIQMYGKAKSGTKRSVNINLDKVIHEDFLGFGDHLFVAGLNSDNIKNIGYDEALFEFDASRANVMGSNIARVWFQVEWIVTDTEKKPQRADYENNKDYQNYINGIYDFDSVAMQSVYKYFDRYDEVGTDLMLNFAWKHDERITTWFSVPSKMPTASAPYDSKAFANAAVATIKNFIDRGYDNVPYLTYYNEPANGSDFYTVGDSATYWAIIAKHTDDALKEAGIRDKVTFFGCEINDLWRNHHTYMDKFVKAESQYDAVDFYSSHHYYKVAHGDNNYQTLYEDMLYFNNEYGKRMMITEMSASEEDCEDPNSPYFYHKDWNDTYTSYIIASANVGVKGVLNWGFGGGYTGSKLGGWQGQELYEPVRILAGGKVNMLAPDKEFYECALLCNYIDPYSDVLMCDWTGDDIRCAVFESSDGEYTILMDTKGGEKPLDVTFALSRAVNKTFYRFQYDRDVETELNVYIPTCQKEISVSKIFTDTVEAKEAMYIYTTKKPRKQITLNEVYVELNAGDSFDFNETLLDCEDGDKVEWIISAATGEEGFVDQNGIYTADNSVPRGEHITVRAQLKSDKTAYATALIEIV